jgi:membrane protein
VSRKSRQGGATRNGWANPFALGLVVGLGLTLADLARRDAVGPRCPPTPTPGAGPTEIAGWRDVTVRAVRAFSADRIPSAAAGVTFYMLLAIFPALSAFISLYGLFADAADAQRHVTVLAGLLPSGAVSVISDELVRLTRSDHGALGFTFIVSLAISVWSSSAGAKALIEALNVAYETPERRGFICLTSLSLMFTLGAIFVGVLALGLVAEAPAMLARVGVSLAGAIGSLLRWPLFVVVSTLTLSVVYRFGPDRPLERWRWITPGGVVAALGWLAMSGLFSWYVAHFGTYDRTYGSLGAIVGFLTWIWISLMVVLFGAELNSEIEQAQEPG